ncbi:MAG: hypothetical protein C5B54_07755 [Acidobacteria bacterium]|nr:MAG: hypothetical protein C5B54_07755 [Acidobacteriota bacterium]
MIPEQWKKIDELFDAALELEPAKREAYLDQACNGDDEVRKEVETLLASDAKANSFIETPAIQLASELPIDHPPRLSPNQSVGPYKILSLLGIGGMGEVYLAQDSRVGRKVAIKLLPTHLSSDSGMRRRFEREARAVSSLSHPNICSFYDIGQEDGTDYLVMEFIEGKTLADTLAKGAMPLQKALSYAIQILDALDKAHQAGVIHRDLKPTNIMLSAKGATLLDFGLAKLRKAGGQVVSTSNTNAMSQSSNLTAEGTIVGTLQYMAPEQLNGQSTDARTDIFAFGTVLYEMLTGQKAFAGKSQASLIAAILTSEPTPVSSIQPMIAPELDRAVKTCLAKDPNERWQSAHDLLMELKWIAEGTFRSAESAPSKYKRLTLIVLLSALLGIYAGSQLFREHQPDLVNYRISPLIRENRGAWQHTWSPNGKTIAYNAETLDGQQIFTLDLSTMTSTQISSGVQGPHKTDPTWSADGTHVYYSCSSNLWAVSAAGGPPEKIFENAMNSNLCSSRNTLAFLRVVQEQPLQPPRAMLWTSSPAGATPKKYENVPGDVKEFLGTPKFSPDGSMIADWVDTTEGIRFWIFPYPQGEARMLQLPENIVEKASFSWMPDNKRFVFGSSREKSQHLMLFGIGDNKATPLSAGYAGSEKWPEISPDGSKIAFTMDEIKGDVIEVALKDEPTRRLSMETWVQSPVWSPNGKQYAFAARINGAESILVKSISDQWMRPVVTQQQVNADGFDSPSFSPDGQRVAYQVMKNHAMIWVSPASGGTPVQLVSGEYDSDFPSWSPDSEWITFYSGRLKGALAKVRTTGDANPIVLKEGMFYYRPMWSPKGDWITLVDENGLSIISPDGQKTELLSKGEWSLHDWSHDGTKIYGFKDEGEHVWVCSVDIKTREEKQIREVTPGYYVGFSLSPDESSFITSLVHHTGEIWLLEGFSQPANFWQHLWAKVRP